MACNLLLHCGAHAVPREQLAHTPTPAATRTWQPIPHDNFVRQVEELLPGYGLQVTNQAHALTHDGSRHFGLMEVQNGSNHPDFAWVIGLRNSHDQSLPAGLVAGSQVFVCDNLAFAGSAVSLSRKHTRFIVRDLPHLVRNAIDRLVHRWHDQDRRIDAYKNCSLGDNEANDLTIQALDRGVIPASRIPDTLHEWRSPRHSEFESRDVWSFFNAFTEVLKQKGRLHDLPKRTTALYNLCDRVCGLN